MLKYFYAIFILILLSGCKNQNEIKIEESTTTKSDTVPEIIKPDFFEGIYKADRYTNSFIDCSNPDSIYWVIDDSKKLENQYYKMFEVQSVYNSVVAKVKADIEVTEDLTLAPQYPMTMRVKEVISVEKKNFNNICVPYDFLALGNNPAWTLEISPKENLIEFKLPGENSFYFFYKEPDIENGDFVYRNHNTIQRYLIEIRIRKEPCTDSKSGKVYDYSAYVGLSDKRIFRGCAIKGKDFITGVT
jgi:uncharacterized membrane protein